MIVDYESLDTIIARQPGKRRLERIPVNEAAPDHASHIVSAWTPDLASVPEEAWQKAVKRFKILKPLLNMGNSERSFAHIKKAARALGKHRAPRQISLSKLFANSIATFAFISARSAHIRRYFWN